MLLAYQRRTRARKPTKLHTLLEGTKAQLLPEFRVGPIYGKPSRAFAVNLLNNSISILEQFHNSDGLLLRNRCTYIQKLGLSGTYTSSRIHRYQICWIPRKKISLEKIGKFFVPKPNKLDTVGLVLKSRVQKNLVRGSSYPSLGDIGWQT